MFPTVSALDISSEGATIEVFQFGPYEITKYHPFQLGSKEIGLSGGWKGDQLDQNTIAYRCGPPGYSSVCVSQNLDVVLADAIARRNQDALAAVYFLRSLPGPIMDAVDAEKRYPACKLSPFSWGQVIKLHRCEEYEIVEYMPWKKDSLRIPDEQITSCGSNLFDRDLGISWWEPLEQKEGVPSAFDYALAHAISVKNGSRLAGEMFMTMLINKLKFA